MRNAWFCGPLVIFTISAQLAAAAAAPPVPVALSVWNETGSDLECQVLAAHWYTLPGLTLPPGGTGRLGLFAADSVLQDGKDLAIERIFCGHAGNAWLTRGELDLRGLAGGASASVVCRAAGDWVGCGG
jgi:hypothetical protein